MFGWQYIGQINEIRKREKTINMNTMKKILMTVQFIALMICSATAQEQTPATEAGEDFDLYRVTELFEEVEDLEEFEQKINDEETEINNLDLNKDDEIDIVKVVEYKDGDTHVLVLQAMLSETDAQDIATVEIEKHSDGEISLQVIGDPDIYGPDFIVEPAKEEGSIAAYRPMAVFVSVRLWRPVVVMFRPGRAVFVSAVVFRPRPPWFRARRPIGRSTWRARARHSPRVGHSRSRHSARGRNMYSSKRKTSPKAKSNFGPSPSPGKGTAASPSNQKKKSAATSPSNQQKKAATSPGKSTSPNKATSPGNQPKKGASPQKKKKH